MVVCLKGKMAYKMEMEDTQTSNSPGNDLDAKKRLRCSNFSSQEKNILIHIVEKYQHVIECKKTDKISVQEREKIWEGIAQEFNEILLAEPTRTPRQLKMCYENLKRRIRREICGDEPKTVQANLDPIVALRSQILVPSDVDSNSSTHIQTSNSSFQGSQESTPGQFQPETYTMQMREFVDTSHISTDKPRRKNANISKLRRILLNKEISSINMDLEMKAKKYELELKVEEAKLEYYRRKIAMLDNRANGQL